MGIPRSIDKRARGPGEPAPSTARTATAVVAALVLAAAGPAGGQVAPDADWRVRETPHFRIVHQASLTALARRTGAVAEEAYRRLRERFVEPPEGRIDVVLSDDTDFANGFARVAPRTAMVVYAHPPVDALSLAYFDDWLELVVTHELTHVVHLDDTGPLGSLARGLFGRVPSEWPLFPGLSTPRWITEGVATWYESALTGSGRLHGSFHEMVVRTAAVEGRLESIDEASGASPVWPAGFRPYTYGAHFFEHLVERSGEDAVADFARGYADRLVPFRLDAAAREAFGVSFAGAWEEWVDSLGVRYRALADTLARRAPATEPRALTRHGYLAFSPRFSPDGSRVAYARRDGRDEPGIHEMRVDGSGGRRRGRTNGAEVLSWAPDGSIVTAQVDLVDPYRRFRDLYRFGADGTERITRRARVYLPDVHPGGGRAVAVQSTPGSTRLVEVDLADGSVTPLVGDRTDEHWAYPRWSPDGRWIAATRWIRGGSADLVVVASDGEVVRRVTRGPALDVTPAWSPDGRWILWSSDRSGIQNLYARRVDGGPLRQVTSVLGGAYHPDVSPDGRWIVYSGYHADGWRIERIPYDPDAWFEPLEARAPGRGRLAGSDPPAAGDAAGDGRVGGRYGGAGDLVPTYWIPAYRSPETMVGRDAVGAGFGVATGATDLVGRHAWGGTATVSPSDGRVSGSLAYEYAGFGNPRVGLSVRQLHDGEGAILVRVEGREAPDTLLAVSRERRASAFVRYLRPRARTRATLTLSAGVVREDRELLELDLEPSRRTLSPEPRRERTLGEVSLAGSWTNARIQPFSVSAEDGVSLFARGRRRHDLDVPDDARGTPGNLLRGDGSFDEALGRASAFLSFPLAGFADHVMAARVSGGVADGPGADAFHFELGGAAGRRRPAVPGLALGGPPLFFPLRGYARAARTGSAIWSASLEYRLPLALVHGGAGLWPLHVDRLSGSVFFDAGDAWGPGDEAAAGSRDGPVLTSAGAELVARILPLWAGSLDLRVGAALPLRTLPGEDGPGGVRAYVRLGRAF